MPAQHVKPYVKRGKNDAADAEAICEAVTRPTMRFVGIKSPEQQSAMMLHRVRLILNRQGTQLSNAMRAHLAEFGITAPIGRNGIEQLLDVIADPTDERVPADARFCLEMLAAQLRIVKEQILENDRRILASARETELGRRLMEIPGVGPLLASAIVATVPDPAIFRSGRNLAAWIGLVPRQNSSGGKERLGGIYTWVLLSRPVLSVTSAKARTSLKRWSLEPGRRGSLRLRVDTPAFVKRTHDRCHCQAMQQDR